MVRCKLGYMLKSRRDSTLRDLVLWSSKWLTLSKELEWLLRLTLKPTGLYS